MRKKLIIIILILIIIILSFILIIFNKQIINNINANKEIKIINKTKQIVELIKIESPHIEISNEFAQKLEKELNQAYPKMDITIQYMKMAQNIEIVFNLKHKNLKLILNSQYILTYDNGNVLDENNNQTNIIIEERQKLNEILNENLKGNIDFDKLSNIIPENWKLSNDTFNDARYICTDKGNTFYIMEEGIVGEQIGIGKPKWVYDNVSGNEKLIYYGEDREFRIHKDTILNNIYKTTLTENNSIRYVRISDVNVLDCNISFMNNEYIENVYIGSLDLNINSDMFLDNKSLKNIIVINEKLKNKMIDLGVEEEKIIVHEDINLYK